jgi:mannose-6-phosphate isomerase
VKLLQNPVRPYAWGSRTAIAGLLGRPTPSPHPEAELWIGAHPTDPSSLIGGNGSPASLLEVLRADPVGQLGTERARRWGSRLPFLLKVLAADEPLSLQAHPSAKQAALGFAREQRAGIPLDAPQRNYKDPDPKPELMCALTEFHMLAGFRPAARTVELLDALAVAQFAPYTELLTADPSPGGLRALFTTWITLPQSVLTRLRPQLLDACVAHIRARGEFTRVCRTVLQLAEHYPDDAGVLASLLLNHLALRPTEAVFLPAGNLHAYLHGIGVEILANSDNVLRGGLTPKHVDVPELLSVLDFSDDPVPVLTGERVREHQTVYRTPTDEFQLSRLDWAAGEAGDTRLPGGRPQILLCTDGTAELSAADGQLLVLRRGASVWLPACDPPVVVRPAAGLDGPCRVFRATTGDVDYGSAP